MCVEEGRMVLLDAHYFAKNSGNLCHRDACEWDVLIMDLLTGTFFLFIASQNGSAYTEVCGNMQKLPTRDVTCMPSI